ADLRAALVSARTGEVGADGAAVGGRAFCSFTADTRVLMADGTSKALGVISVGDRVRAADPQSGATGARAVAAVWIHQDDFVLLSINGQTVKTTRTHPFWNNTVRRWQRVDELRHGDKVLTADGSEATVDGIVATLDQPQAAYNLTANDLHTYYVLAGTTP